MASVGPFEDTDGSYVMHWALMMPANFWSGIDVEGYYTATFEVNHVEAPDEYVEEEGEADSYTTTFEFTLTCSDCAAAPTTILGGWADFETAEEELREDLVLAENEEIQTLIVEYSAANELADVNPDDLFYIEA